MPKSALGTVQSYHPEVTRVVDAKKGIDIEVRKSDCKLGDDKSPASCAMARAAKRTFDGAIVSMSIAYLIKGKTAIRYLVPVRIAREIVSFDRHHDFRPGLYSLIAPYRSLKMDVMRKKRQAPPKRKLGGAGKYRRRVRTSGVRSL